MVVPGCRGIVDLLWNGQSSVPSRKCDIFARLSLPTLIPLPACITLPALEHIDGARAMGLEL